MLTRLGHFTVRRHRLVLSLTVLFMVAAAVLGTRAFGVLQDDGFADPGVGELRAPRRSSTSASPATSRTPSSSSRASRGDVDDPARRGGRRASSPPTVRAVEDVADVTSYWDLGAPPALRSTDGAARARPGRRRRRRRRGRVDRGRPRRRRDGPAGHHGRRRRRGGRRARHRHDDRGRPRPRRADRRADHACCCCSSCSAGSSPRRCRCSSASSPCSARSCRCTSSARSPTCRSTPINLTTALGLGLAIDYSLFIVSRYREELRHGRSVERRRRARRRDGRPHGDDQRA